MSYNRELALDILLQVNNAIGGFCNMSCALCKMRSLL